jgi:hypothetical protein
VFPVRYELNSYINLLRNSVFKGLKLSHSNEYENDVMDFGTQEPMFRRILLCLSSM